MLYICVRNKNNDIMKTKKNIKLIPVKYETKKKGYRKYLVNVVLWGCNLELTKFDGTKEVIGSGAIMNLQDLKRDAVKEAENYKEYILSKGDFYFI